MEAAEEAAVLVEAGLPPQAARAPAALKAPTAFKKERREITFFIMSSPYLSYRRPFIPDRSCWPYYRKSLSFCPSVAYTIFRKFSCLFRTNIWDTSYLLAIFANFIRRCSHFVIISAQFVIFNRKNIFSPTFSFLKFIFSNGYYFSSIFGCSAQHLRLNYGKRYTCQAAEILLYFLYRCPLPCAADGAIRIRRCKTPAGIAARLTEGAKLWVRIFGNCCSSGRAS